MNDSSRPLWEHEPMTGDVWMPDDASCWNCINRIAFADVSGRMPIGDPGWCDKHQEPLDQDHTVPCEHWGRHPMGMLLGD